MSRAAGLLLVACLALYAPTMSHFFVSDDFLNIERNVFRTFGEGLRLFSAANVDFYRPLPRLHFGVLWGAVGDDVLVWNFFGVLLHGLTAVAAMILAADLLGDQNRRAARYAGLFFALHFIHVEPVVWASGVTSTYVTLFLLLSLIYFRHSRRTGALHHRLLSIAMFWLALLSKETAVAFAPLLVLTTAWWPGEDRHGEKLPRILSLSEAAPYAVMLIAYLVLVLGMNRGGDASPYQMAFGTHVVKNTAFFLAGGFAPIRFWEIQQTWDQVGGGGGLFAFVTAVLRHPLQGVPLVLTAVALVVGFLKGGHHIRGGILLILCAALPFLPLSGSGERFLYLPSFGACLVLGIAAQSILRIHTQLPGGHWGARAIVLLLAAGLIAGNLDRQADWARAAGWTRGIVARWGYLQNLDAQRPIVFEGIPESYRSAWVFRNGFDSMARLYWEGRPYRRAEDSSASVVVGDRMEVRLDPDGPVGMILRRHRGSP